MRAKLALRNLFRNQRRTGLSVAMIAGGVSAILIFEGFAFNVLKGIQDTTIRTQTSHLQIALNSYWDKTAPHPKDALLVGSKKLEQELRALPEVEYTSGRLTFFGLLSASETSQSAKGVSFDPSVEGNLSSGFKFISGTGLTDTHGFQVALGSGLAAKLSAKTGDSLTLLTHTYEGVVNAIDVEVSGIFRTAMAGFDDSTFLIPLGTAQGLMDTDRVELVVVGLKQTTDTDKALAEVSSRLSPNAAIKPWYALSRIYRQVTEFNKIQNRVMAFIILMLILLGILNTVGMSVFERTGEIGTIAALGEGARSILMQFLMEGFLLGVMGSLAGLLTGLLLMAWINWLEIALVIPGASELLTVRIDFYSQAFFDSCLIAVGASTAAAWIPSLRASKMNIAEALRRNV